MHCPTLKLKPLCRAFGKSTQSYYGLKRRVVERRLTDTATVTLVKSVRAVHPGYGLRKLHFTVNKQGFRVGRDRLRDILKTEGLLFKPKARIQIKTTDSRHSYALYPNLIRNIDICHPEEVFVSDITAIRVNGNFCFLAVVTDAWSRKIMGWRFGEHNTGELAGGALMAAWANRIYPERIVIHHSDRGSQYCCGYYRALLHKLDMTISTTETGDPRENAIAERVFRTLKREYGLNRNFGSPGEASKTIKNIINLYNHSRIHASCGFNTPAVQHIVHKKSPLFGVNII
jgi:putative transposase